MLPGGEIDDGRLEDSEDVRHLRIQPIACLWEAAVAQVLRTIGLAEREVPRAASST